MAYLTLAEAAKLGQGTALDRAIINIYTGSSELLAALPMKNINGNALKYNREAKYPGVGFRGVNEAYTPSAGILNPVTEALVIAGGDLDVDKFIVDTEGSNVRGEHVRMKAEALALAITNKMINGDTANDVREFDGLKTRITGAQKIKAGTSSGGDALSLAIVDQALRQTKNPTHLIMNRAMADRFAQAARTYTVGGYIQFSLDQFGKKAMAYNGIPILTVDLDNNEEEILPFTEASESGASVSTSIYVVSLGGQGVLGLQNGSINTRDLGELNDQPVLRTRVEWYMGMAVYNGRAATRIYQNKNAAIVA